MRKLCLRVYFYQLCKGSWCGALLWEGYRRSCKVVGAVTHLDKKCGCHLSGWLRARTLLAAGKWLSKHMLHKKQTRQTICSKGRRDRVENLCLFLQSGLSLLLCVQWLHCCPCLSVHRHLCSLAFLDLLVTFFFSFALQSFSPGKRGSGGVWKPRRPTAGKRHFL